MPGTALSTAATAPDAMKWRCIGPPRGGRVVAVAGDANNPVVAYFGACAGGIWKTTDAGVYWRCVSDGYLASAAVGAIAVACSDSNVIYAGMGETAIRLDVSYGDGVYKSTDAGESWSNVGLRDTKHIGRICIHPDNPDIVFVAALGDIFGPHDDRGVFRTRDGGKTWEKILHVNADSGAIDMSMDPNNPRILFASIWESRRNFWNISSGGPGSGLFRSTDSGDTWQDISRNAGLPAGLLGKIGVSISPARAGRVWALVEAKGEKTGLYRSDDCGERWTQVSSNRDLMHRPWYYTHVFADPCHPETVYINNLNMWKSTDGGTNFTEINTPHGDNHDLWIDPANSKRMVQGNDGGACVSFNGGMTWSSIYNQLTAQFYRIAVDDQYPYLVYGTQQDNTSIGVPSATAWGAVTLGDCIYPGTGESGFIAVHPDDPNVVFCGAIGSSPGGAGALQRYDHRTRQMQLVNVWPEESTGIAPKDLKYRFAWTFPIVFSPHDSGVLYAGGNHVFRTRDEGMSWERISPDLSLNDVTRQDYSGGPITRESAGAEVHATCACVVESPHRKGEIWASTDDGLVHVTIDDGATWQNVTPPGMPSLAYVGCVEPSAHDPNTVYVAATCYKLSNYSPYLFRTGDGGQTWQSITGDLPTTEITRVVREDPMVRGLLFIGTETGIFYSLDDGRGWVRMSGGLPIVPVYDLKVKGSDLVAGTHGRSFWVLDDFSPLRDLAAGRQGVRLIQPRTTVRTKLHFGALNGVRGPVSFGITFGIGGGIATTDLPDGTKRREYLDVGENPPNGVIIYYWLDDSGVSPVAISIRDAGGRKIVSFRSDDANLPTPRRPSTRAGLNRYVWDMKSPGPDKLDSALAPPRNRPLVNEPDAQSGPTVVPGDYFVDLEAGSVTQSQSFAIRKDPRYGMSQEDYVRQFDLLTDLSASLSALNRAVNRIRRAGRQLDELATRAEASAPDLTTGIKDTLLRMREIEGVLVDVNRETPRDHLRNPAGLNDTLIDLFNNSATSDTPPTTQAVAVSRDLIARVGLQLTRFDTIMEGEVGAINQAAVEARLAAVTG